MNKPLTLFQIVIGQYIELGRIRREVIRTYPVRVDILKTECIKYRDKDKVIDL